MPTERTLTVCIDKWGGGAPKANREKSLKQAEKQRGGVAINVLHKLLSGYPFNVCDLANFRELENPRIGNYTYFVEMSTCMHPCVAIGVALTLNN